jgi:hypothetical protein
MNDFLENTLRIFAAARDSDDGQRCAVSMSPDAREKLKAALASARDSVGVPGALSMRASEPRRLGFNDGVIIRIARRCAAWCASSSCSSISPTGT